MYPPAISMSAKRYLSVPVSSRPVERLFSITGNIFCPERCHLTDKVIESLTVQLVKFEGSNFRG